MKWFSVVLLIWSGCFMSSCTASRTLQHDEAEIIAWYVEDVTHGNQRRPGEIQLKHASEAMARVERWLVGNDVGDRVVQPRFMDLRLRRWPAVRGFMQTRAIAVIATGPDKGLLAPSKELNSADLALVAAVVDAENNDRRALDALVLSTARLDEARARAFVALSASARIELDQAAGAILWQGATAP